MVRQSATRPCWDTLAEALVRRRSRARAAAELRQLEPACFARLAAAHAEGQAHYRAAAVPLEHYLDTALHVLGRIWKRRLRAPVPAGFADALRGLTGGTLLRDLVALRQGLDHPCSGASAFYAAFPTFAATVDGWRQRAARAQPDLQAVTAERFRRKCYGTALYHLLAPLRAALGEEPDAGLGFGADPAGLLRGIAERGLFQDLYFAVALGHGDADAVARFHQRYLGLVTAKLVREGVARDRAASLVADLATECMLKACQFFAMGSFAGWLLCVCESYLERERPATWVPPVQEPAAEPEPALAEALDPGAAQALFAAAFQALDPDGQRLVCLHQGQGLGVRAIAPRVGVHYATVSRRLTVALAELRAGLIEAARDQLGSLASEAACQEFLLAHARAFDLRALCGLHDPPASAPEQGQRGQQPEPTDLDCPMVPGFLP